MEEIINLLIKLVPELGFSVVFLVLLFLDRKDRKEKEKEKDDKIYGMFQDLLTSYNKNTEVTGKVNSNLDQIQDSMKQTNENIQSSAKIIDRLVSNVDFVLRNPPRNT